MPSAPMFFDSHMHTPLCKHAIGHPRAYALQGRRRGLGGVIFTCHSPMPDGWSANVRMAPGEFKAYVDLIEEAAAELADEVVVRLGMESDFFPGMESWLEELHGRADFHYILGSVHYHVSEYYQRYFNGNLFEYQELYFEHLADSAQSGLFDALAHPDLVKNAAPEEWEPARIRPAIARALDRIAETGVAMELNTSGLNKSLPEMNPGMEMLEMMRERAIPVVLGSDAHTPERVGADFEFALESLAAAGFTEVQVFERRRPVAHRIGDVRAAISNTGMSSVGMACR